jgi:dihydrofolate reductase
MLRTLRAGGDTDAMTFGQWSSLINMARTNLSMSISADGYVAGPDQSPEEPLGVGGERLHDWVLKTAGWRASHGYEGGESGVDSDVAAAGAEGIGAVIMGRNMFGGGPGPWEESWKGWWGDQPPFHHDVFVITHHPREPLEMDGGTTFYFVTGGIEAALERAKESAGDRDVMLSGGAEVINRYLAAGLLDELDLHIAPVLLGGGARLFDGLAGTAIELEQVRAVEAPGVTHVKYRLTT